MPDETNDENNDSQEDENSEELSQEEIEKQEQEKQEKEDTEDEEEFHIHKGKIMEIVPFKEISSVSFDKSYDSPTGTGKLEIPYSKETYNDIYKFIYKGVLCKLKIRRTTDKQFSDTGLEELGTPEEEKKRREHYPTKEQLEELGLNTENSTNTETQSDNQEGNIDEGSNNEGISQESPKLYSRSASDDGLFGFVTDVKHSQSSTEIDLKDYGYCLEDNSKELTFNNLPRSVILAEVIKSYGLIPIIDVEGLNDDVISWSNITNGDGSGGSSDSNGSLEQSSKFDDCTTTFELSAAYKVVATQQTGYIPDDIDSKTEYMKAIGKTGTNYAEYVKGCKTACEVVKKLRDGWGYRGYADNPYYKCVEDVFKHRNAINCADSSKLLKCCFDVCGITSVIIHGNNHYFNAVKVDGKWYNVDLCFRSNIGKSGTTNTLGC